MSPKSNIWIKYHHDKKIDEE
jgi:hypothetical protein